MEIVNISKKNEVYIKIDSDASTAVKDSELTRGSGEIIYIDNRATISRADDQTEDFKIILEF